MPANTHTFANGMGEALAPLLIAIRSTGFFEAYVFIPLMTGLSIFLFLRIKQHTSVNGSFDGAGRLQKWLWLTGLYTMCFLATNSTAVAFKTLIIEETDYPETPWFMALVSPLHFYITSAALAYMWLVLRNRAKMLDGALSLYVQLALCGGYYIALDRLIYEPFDLLDVTSGFSGVFFILWFGLINWDVMRRFRSDSRTNASGLATV